MSDLDKLRDRATRLLALALRARERGYSHADELATLANEALAQAEDMERRERAAPIPTIAEQPQQAAQQQQQPQSKKE